MDDGARAAKGCEVMALLGPFDRPIALNLLDAERISPSPRPRRPPASTADHDHGLPDAAPSERIATSRFLLEVLVGAARPNPEVVARLETTLIDGVRTWTPFVSTSSRIELVGAVVDGDDAITDVDVFTSGHGTATRSAYLEWNLTGRFANVGFLNDDVLVEPSGAVVECSGIAVFEFIHDRVSRIHLCFDALSLLEQVLVPCAARTTEDGGRS